MWTLMQGGPILWFIVLASIIAAVIFLEKLLHLHRAQIQSQVFLTGIYNNLRRNNFLEAVSICEDTPGPVARIVQSAILHHDESEDQIRRAVEDAGRSELPRLESHLGWLATIAKITPLMGLLGTVIGIIQTLFVMQQKAPLIHAGDLSGGLYEALITTAAGLVVAIPIYAGYNLLLGRIERIVREMDEAARDIMTFVAKRKVMETLES